MGHCVQSTAMRGRVGCDIVRSITAASYQCPTTLELASCPSLASQSWFSREEELALVDPTPYGYELVDGKGMQLNGEHTEEGAYGGLHGGCSDGDFYFEFNINGDEGECVADFFDQEDGDDDEYNHPQRIVVKLPNMSTFSTTKEDAVNDIEDDDEPKPTGKFLKASGQNDCYEYLLPGGPPLLYQFPPPLRLHLPWVHPKIFVPRLLPCGKCSPSVCFVSEIVSAFQLSYLPGSLSRYLATPPYGPPSGSGLSPTGNDGRQMTPKDNDLCGT
ncbi:hypothetical protein B0T18DRAFT_236506 [Schizothecium vesticola]|uniref:Uncharacterized protein n=1 Tax=Schizothecium vesticola TaxID=314040 RepID=A0AA40BPB1_9PEZI|nr:hypothetical protein B0T18DRAFT_236506 [Schizothecium vesticola]